ncbi:hypothetical protein RJT34_17263 [Clitoria ternatea]|uniref:TIR domain-containing protein n=1 Tax=Clitoria ternatea TaxID=43366 RepID=A0AAN9J9X0_CLITE
MCSFYESYSKRYGVFISFRGEDTRIGFASHLHGALRAKGIETFVDYDLKRGDDVWPKLSSAIEDSNVSVVVFSENYANSKWCLQELEKIIECRNKGEQVVVPVFYKTDPSDIRNQRGSYGKPFEKHEQDLQDNESNKAKVFKWRDVLTQAAAKIVRWDSPNYNDPSDIKKDNESNKAKVFKWKDALTQAAKISGWDSRNYKDEFQFIKEIVDDVNQKLCQRSSKELDGIEGIVGACKHVESLLTRNGRIGIWGMGGIALGTLGDGSKLIITRRNKQVLSEKDAIYEVEQWDLPKSLKLFRSKAGIPKGIYEDFSKRAVKYAGGVPLALEVLGSYFGKKKPELWEQALTKFEEKKESFQEVEEILRVSYNDLTKLEQTIFLDIAFFFKDEVKMHVTRILDACGFSATSGIQVLEEKSLIKISKSNTIQCMTYCSRWVLI